MATTKTTVTKKPTVKKSTSKKTTVKKAPVKKASTTRAKKARKIGAEERYKMIEVAAYYIAEQHGFQGNPIDYWTAAEAEVNAKLAA